MLQFHAVTLKDKEWMTAFYREQNIQGAQYSFASNFLWQEGYGIEVCLEQDAFYLRSKPNGQEAFYRVPLVRCADRFAYAMECLEQHCLQEGEPLRLIGILQEQKQQLEQTFPGKYCFREMREDAEYIYLREQLESLPGKKLHAKRNFVNRFCKKEWKFVPLTKALTEQCWQMHVRWCQAADCGGSQGLCAERAAVRRCFECWDELDLCGGVLYQEGQAVAYTVGEKIGKETFAVHFEKAYSHVEGAYATVNQMFIKQSAKDCLYVNREEDMGDPGLRQAKLSYLPVKLLEMWEAVPNDVV